MERFILKNGLSVPLVASRSNGLVVDAAKLTERKYREISGAFLLEGEKLFEEAVLWGEPVSVFVSSDHAERLSEKTLGYLSDPRLRDRVFALSASAFSKISTEKAPQGVIAAARIPDFYRSGENGARELLAGDLRSLVLDGVRDPGNVGGILRSAAAFGFDGAILIDSADPFGDRAVRASMGAVFRMRTVAVRSAGFLRDAIGSSGRRLVASALSENSETLGEFLPSRRDVPVIGNEGHGISGETAEIADVTLRIPMAAGCESLNAGAAAAVVLWEYFKQSRKE